jgi:UDP-glucose 4-epimerase
MRYLITGGAGFIGSHLAEMLLKGGNEVCVIDDLSTGSIRNIEHLKGMKGFYYRIDTIFNEPVLAELIDSSDMIFHLAAAVGVMLIVESPVRTIQTNISGTEIVLRLASKKKKPVLFTSTSEVYGKSTKIPYSEEDDLVLGPTTKSRWSYACSKAIDEFLAISYWKEKRLPTVIARVFNTVGPRQTGRYGMVIPRFIEQALSGKAITVYGDGRQSRTFCYVEDVVKGLIDLLHNERSYGEVFNIGSDEEITIEDLAKLIKRKTSSSSRIEYIPYDQAYEAGFEDMRRRVPDLRKIKEFIGYHTSLKIEQIIDKIVESLK